MGITVAAVCSLVPSPASTFLRPISTTTTFYPSSSSSSTSARALTPTARRPARVFSVARPAPVAASLRVSHDTGVKMPGADIVGQNDLLIVGPGVFGRLVAEKWQKVLLAVADSSLASGTAVQHQLVKHKRR